MSSNMYHYTDSPENEIDDDAENMYGAGNKHDKVISASHVNGGLSNICQIDGRILVYRKEEWFKVLIHESMHNYGLDFSILDISMANKKLHSIFSIQTDIKIFESYSAGIISSSGDSNNTTSALKLLNRKAIVFPK